MIRYAYNSNYFNSCKCNSICFRIVLTAILFSKTLTIFGQSNDTKSPFQFINYTNTFNPGSPNQTEDTNVTFIILNDTNNVWQIGRPNKPPLDTTFSPPNALLTDTVNSYPVNNHSIFEVRARKPLDYPFLCWSWMSLQIAYISNVDSLRDGLYIEVSYNDSGVWNNVSNDSFADEKTSDLINHYPNDTLFNGEWGLSHLYQNIPSWFSYFDVSWRWLTPSSAQQVDSVAFRFHFISDSLNTNKQGFEIIYIHFDVSDLCSAFEENVDINNLTVFPNPVNELSMLKFSNLNCENFKIEIVDNIGKIIFEEETSDQQFHIGNLELQKGIYYYRLSNKYGVVKIDKFVKT